jgi:6-phosphogluconolactonase/glucosamine-6-phosphate isomerase/deaminase
MSPEQRKDIERHAIEIANGDERAVCPYEKDTEERKVWTAAFYGQLYRLSGEESA